MMKHQSPNRLRTDSKGGDLKEEPPYSNIDFQIRSLEEDHSSIMKKYEQLSKTKSEGYNQPTSSDQSIQQYHKLEVNGGGYDKIRSNTPNKVNTTTTQANSELYQSAQQILFSTDLGLMEEKSKEERILQQLVEDYKITNKDLSQKLDLERQEVLDQRVKIHNYETEIKFCKKENQRLTSLIESYGQKKQTLLGQNIQGNQSSNIIYSGSSFGEIPMLSQIANGDKTDQIVTDNQKRIQESKIIQLEELNLVLNQEKSALTHQNRILDEKISFITKELDLLKNQLQNKQIKDKVSVKEDVSAKEIEITSLKETIQLLRKEQQDISFQFQQKINQKNIEIEKLLSLNEILDKQLRNLEQNIHQKEEFIVKVQGQDQSVVEREKLLLKENERMGLEIGNLSSQIKQLNEQIVVKTSKQQSEQSQLQKELQLANQEKEALTVQTKGQQETIQMLNQQIAILERISNETSSTQQNKKSSEEKTVALVKKELEDVKIKNNLSEKQIEQITAQNQNLQKQISLIEEESKCLKLTKTQSDDKSQTLIQDQTNYLKLIDQLQQEVCSLNATIEDSNKKHLEKEKQLQEALQKYKQEINNTQSINAMFEKQILNVQTQLSEKKSELDAKNSSSNNHLNEMKFLEERLINLQKQNDLYSQKILSLESRGQTMTNATRRSSALTLLEEGVSKQFHSNSATNINSNDGDEKLKALQKSYNQVNEQCMMQLKQIDMLNQTISELQKALKQNANNNNNNQKNLQLGEKNILQQIPSTSDFQDYNETSKKKIFLDSRELSMNNLEQSPEKIIIQDLDVQQMQKQVSNEGDKQQLVMHLQTENRRLLDKIMQVEQAFNQLSNKVETLTKQNTNNNNTNNSNNNNNNNLNNLNNLNNNLPPLPYPTTPVMTQNHMIFSKSFKSAEKPPQNPLQNSGQKNQEKDLTVSAQKRQKIFEPYNSRRNLSSDRKSPNTRYLNNSIEINPGVNASNYQSFTSSPNRSYPDGFGHKRQNTLPTVFNSQQDFYKDQNQANYNNNSQRLKTQEIKRPSSFNSPHQIFASEQKQKKNKQNEESVLLFSPINLVMEKKKGVSQDEADDLMSNGSVDGQMKQMIYPHLNVYEYYEQMQNNGSQCTSMQILKFDRNLFGNYQMSKESMLKYKQAAFLSKLMYIETKEGLQIGCISQQERDQDQIYLNLNLFYKNISNIPIDQLYVTLSGSNTCQAFAKPTVSNWSLSPNIQSKQELFFKFNSIPFGPIFADIIYQCKDIKKKFQLYLPVNIVKFLEQRTIQADRLLSKYLKIKMNPKNSAKLQNGFIIKSEKFCLDRKFALNINDFAQFLPHFQRIPSLDRLNEFMMGGNDFQIGGSYLLRENNLIFYMIISVKTNKYATFEIFSESSNLNHIPICENILQNFIYLFINPEM